MNGEDFKEIIADTQSIIMPGMVQWYHPNFYAYYPNGNSYPSILGELMMAGLNTLAFSWVYRNAIGYYVLLQTACISIVHF